MIVRISSTLKNLCKAIDGLVSMSSDLDSLFYAIYDNRVCELWQKVSYPSLKALGSWILDFLQRLQFI